MKTPTYLHVFSSPITTTIMLSPLLLLSFVHSIPTVESSSSPPPPPTTVNDFIKKSCKVTLYQDLCYSSLSGQYPGQADQLGSLTCTAMKVSLTEATSFTKYVSSVNWTASPVSGHAVQDCTKLAKRAAGQIRQSLTLMEKVVRAYEASNGAYNETQIRKMRFDLSSVQTWMSAGITGQDTCMEGWFKDVGVKDDDKLEIQVYEKVGVVIKLISNALALVNSYVDGFR